MELFGGQLHVKWSWLVELYGIPDNDLKSRAKRFRAGKSAEWAIVSDSADKRRKWFRYDSIPEAERRIYGLPTPAEAEALYHQRQGKQATSRRALTLYEALCSAVATKWPALRSGFTHRVSAADAEGYARLQAALDWCLDNSPKPYSRAEVLPAFQDLRLPFRPAGSSAYALFTRKLNGYAAATDKAAFLLARRGAPAGNKNSVKLGPEQQAWLIQRFGDYMKPSLEDTWADYKAHRAAFHSLDWPELSLASIKKMLNANRPAWEARRHGMLEAVKKVGYVLKKRKPSEPDLLIEFDGTQEPFFYRNELGERDGRVYSVRIWDLHSGCIVGSAYGISEDADLVLAALQDYLLRQRRQPHQFRYDKGGANVSQAVQELLAATGAVKFASTAKRPTARRSEKLLGQFQAECQKDLRGFRGSNRTSNRNRDLKPHPDRLAKEWKSETWESIVAQCLEAEHIWNHGRYSVEADSETRWERYQRQGEKGRTLSLARLAELLFVERKKVVRYTTHGLEIQAPDGTRHHFEPQTAPGVVDLNLHGQLAGEASKFRVWEQKDGSRELVLVQRENGRGGWLEMGQKTAWPEALADMAPGQQRAHRALLLADATRKQKMLETPRNQDWRAEIGPNGQSKEDWNEAELHAELADAARAERSSKRPKRPVPVKPAPASSAGSSWFLNNM